jgi:hypothetical protein
MHLIANTYHWDRDTLWNLRKREREIWVKLIIKQSEYENSLLDKNTKISDE